MMDFAPLQTLDDASLSERVAEHKDLEAFQVLLGRHLRLLRTYLALRAPMPALVDDVVQDVFLYVYEHMDSLPIEPSLQPCLRRLALQRVVERLEASKEQRMWQKHYGAHFRYELAKEGMEREDRNDASRLGECIAALPANVRQIMGLRYQEGISCESIAEQMGRSEESIRRLLVRVRHQLKHCIESRAARPMIL
jgi:RNA polymerase sigma-70 factor, ECF subfamily